MSPDVAAAEPDPADDGTCPESSESTSDVAPSRRRFGGGPGGLPGQAAHPLRRMSCWTAAGTVAIVGHQRRCRGLCPAALKGWIMGEAIGQSLPLAVGVALSPVPIIAVVLMLTTSRARSNGLAFVIGWLFGLAVVGAIVLAVAGPGDASEDGQPAAWISWLKLVLGLLLLLVAVRQFRGRPRGEDEAPLPTWMGAVDRFKPGTALGSGVALAAANPKNLLLSVAAAAAIAQTGIAGSQQALSYAISSLSGR